MLVFVAVLAAAHAMELSHLPLHLMPATRVLIGLAAPLIGVAVAWLLTIAVGAPESLADYEAAVLGAWLVLALGAWMKTRFEEGLRARVAVIGSREFAADFVAELAASGFGSYEVVGWIDEEESADYQKLRWLGPVEGVRAAVIREGIDLLVSAPVPSFGGGTSTE